MYIDKHWKELYSPYTGESLDEEWKKELVSGDLQEYFDFLLTACYEWENDIEKCVLGESLIFHGITIDPGAMGLGIIDEKEEISDAYDDLCDIYIQADKEKKGIMFTF